MHTPELSSFQYLLPPLNPCTSAVQGRGVMATVLVLPYGAPLLHEPRDLDGMGIVPAPERMLNGQVGGQGFPACCNLHEGCPTAPT